MVDLRLSGSSVINPVTVITELVDILQYLTLIAKRFRTNNFA